MAYIENDGSEMAADLKRDFLAGGGKLPSFLCPVWKKNPEVMLKHNIL